MKENVVSLDKLTLTSHVSNSLPFIQPIVESDVLVDRDNGSEDTDRPAKTSGRGRGPTTETVVIEPDLVKNQRPLAANLGASPSKICTAIAEIAHSTASLSVPVGNGSSPSSNIVEKTSEVVSKEQANEVVKSPKEGKFYF